MKRIIVALLGIVMVLSLAACGGTTDTPETTLPQQIDSGNESVMQATPAETETVEVAPQFEEITVVDNEYCTIRITGIDPDDMWGYCIKLYLENKSEDVTFMYASDYASVNGVQIETLFAEEVAPGKKCNATLNLLENDLEENGIGTYADIALGFRVYDTDDWSADDVAVETVHVYPLGEEKAEKYVRQAQQGDVIIADNEYAKVTVIGYGVDEIWGYTTYLYIENKTDKTIMVSADEVSVNGYMIDPFYADSVGAGNSLFSSMSWSETDFEENGITDVEDIEFVLRIYDDNDWNADDFFNDIVQLTP